MLRKILTYNLYGLTVRSPVPLPATTIDRPAGLSDVELCPAYPARFSLARSSIRTNRWFERHKLADGTTYLRWRGLCEFLVSSDGRHIQYHPLELATAEAINVYLLGQVLSFSLVARGVDPLHGSAVAVNGEAVAFVGDCGSGKSTLAAAFVARGCSIVTDDLIATFNRNERWHIHPGVPRVKLFSVVARHVLGLSPAESGVPMNRETRKRVIPLEADRAVGKCLPLKSIYVLAGAGRDRTVRIERLIGRDAFLAIIRGAFNLLILDRERLRNQFAFASRFVDTVPVYALHYPRTFSRLSAVCDAISDHAACNPRVAKSVTA